ncbi:Septin-7 [Trichinella murrelli]|uniref:Septin-7 n=1 Tax=Trichinella murrelli TaxID=144512 RepID=A0A0V0TKB5_9BILA|nr:Septin-7 [Trichinella murrelli]
MKRAESRSAEKHFNRASISFKEFGRRTKPSHYLAENNHIYKPGMDTRTIIHMTSNGQSQKGGKKWEKGVSSAYSELRGFVGFSYLPNQVHGNALKKGFEFTIMVVGESGLGKSTLLNTLFMADIYPPERKSRSKPLHIEENVVHLVENGVKLALTVVDTPGFGDAIDNNNSWKPIVQYIDQQYLKYFEAETKINRSVNIPDQRVHCCLYFVPPNGDGLKALDIQVLQKLHDRVNIIPIIAKADTLLPEECQRMKETILNQIEENGIQIYDFPETESGRPGEQMLFKDRLPFAVVGSSDFCEINGKNVRCRKYPWGVVEVENPEHNDFTYLKNSLIKSYMLDLVDVTNYVHYENFRCRQMLSACDHHNASELTMDPFTQIEEERRQHQRHLEKMESDINQVFEQKIKEKMEKLAKLEEEVGVAHHINDIQINSVSVLARRTMDNNQQLEQKRAMIQEKMKTLADDKFRFKEEHPSFTHSASADSLKDESHTTLAIYVLKICAKEETPFIVQLNPIIHLLCVINEEAVCKQTVKYYNRLAGRHLAIVLMHSLVV